MTTVELRQGESQDQLLKRFRKKVMRDRVLSEARKKRFYLSPSEKRRIAERKARRRELRRRWRALSRRRRF